MRSDSDRMFGGDAPYPDGAAELHRIWSVILDALANHEDVAYVELIAGGDGQGQFSVQTERSHADGSQFATIEFANAEDNR